MLKFSNKREVDRHVSQMTKNLNENERSTRGYAISRSYVKVSEYEMARDWLQRYLDVKSEDAVAHKFMGEIYEHLKKPEHAITSYQRAYNLNPKQTDLIKNICRLFLVNDGWTSSPGKAKYWCELADAENVRDDNVLTLRLKMLNKDKKSGGKPVEEMILKEIAGRPHDVGLRIRLVKFLLDEKRVSEAFKYCFDLEMKFMEIFLLSIEWYTTVSSVLAQNVSTDNWNYWCLLLICIDKKIYLNLKKDLSLQAIKQNNIKEVTNLIFEFDQVLKKAADSLLILAPVKELAEEFINHFRGQMALHIASLLFQKQKVASNDQWRETSKKCLPFLLFAFQCSTVNTDAFWLKNTNDTIRNLFNQLKKEGAFRCAQAGRTILACKSSESEEIVNNIRSYKSWASIEDIFNQVRETCVDLNWRKNVYRVLFANTDQQTKVSTSYLVQNSYFQEPKYEIISFNDLETFEVVAQYLYPSSLEHHVYLGLGRKDLHSYKSYTFSGLNLSASNLINCNPETINRIDIDSFLYCAIIQAKRRLEAEKDCYESFSSKPNEKPLILPAANMVEGLCTEEQNDWWLSAFKIYKNISGENLAQLKATLQFGIEAVRGIDSPKVDVIILLKLGDVLLARAGSGDKMDERRHFELRVEYVYKMAMRMLKSRDSDNMRRIFKFATTNLDIDREIDSLAGTAIGHLSGIYFKQEEYKEFIEDFGGLQNPWAHYFRAEAYKKLDEYSKTPKKNKKLYAEKARENLVETLALLDSNEDIDKNNPLRMRVEKELKKMQYNLSSSFNEEFNNASLNGHTDDEGLVFHNASSTSFRGRRDLSSINYNEKFQEVDSLIKKLTDLVVTVKDDVLCVRNDISELKDEILNVRGDIADMNINRDSTSTKALTDVYKIMEDLAWNVSYIMSVMPSPAGAAMTPAHAARFQQNPLQAQFNQMYNTAYPMYQMQPQYQTSMMQRPPQPGIPGQIPPGQLPFEALGPNLMMNPQSGLLDLQSGAQKSSLMEALNTPSLLNTWTNTYNQQAPMSIPSQLTQPPQNITTPVIPAQTHAPIQNKPVEKAPPVNVVITSSDPLPAQNSFVSQPMMSVTIPPQHIKHAPQPVFQTTPIMSSTVSKPQYENVSPTKFDTSGYLEEPADYDPRPDFQPIIPLPDEIEVKTGEENEDIAFSERCKLFRLVEGEWKERGIGNIKILKNRETGKYRILMRREQIHKLCANHVITPELELKATPKDNQWIWAANDFSEEQMQLEKFLVRFKNSEQAKRFKDSFNEAKKSTPKKPTQEKIKEALKPKDDNTKVKPVASPAVAPPTAFSGSSTPKTSFTFGGLTGALTPSTGLFSPSVDKSKDKEADKSKIADKPSPFANFSFGQGASNKSFSELFGNISTNKESQTASSTQVQSSAVNLSLNTSNTNEEDVDHYEPTAQFEPVIPLPDLVEAKTGEEDENVTFAHRAKLLRFDTTTKEWKERGIGEMKVLVHKNDPNKARLLMRREQIFKLCCNMVITKDLKFVKLNATTYSFGGQDFSENEMRTEALAIKFKTAELIEQFLETVRNAQKNMGVAIESQEHNKDNKSETPKGFGDKFKPKAGSWDCKSCYISNKADTLYCCACESPKDDTVPKKEAKSLTQLSAGAPKFSFGMPAAPAVTTQSNVIGFGDQFKPKAGSWDCKSCYISNKADTLYCCACESPKDDTVPKKEAKSLLQPETEAPKFNFGMPAAPAVVSSSNGKGFGDQFKPKAGCWDCKACYVSNKSDTLYCCACESPKDDTVPKKESKSLLQPAADVPKFSFGMNSGPGFSFGMPAPLPIAPTAESKSMPNASFSFGSPATVPTTAADSTTKTNGFGFGSKPSFGFGFGSTKSSETLPVPVVEATSGSEAPGFNFVFKKKSPSKVKSPGKTRNDSVNSEGAEEDEDEYHEEENQTYFTPVIALPDKIEVKTGEENEEVLYTHRAKLFRFVDKEWKERGLGDIKILKHRETGKLRVVMRREQIFKICLNFQLTNDIELKPKDDNSWTFAALDFSEGEVDPTQFAIRLKNKEIAGEFKKAIDDALAGSNSGSATSEEDENAKLEKRLMLPAGFFNYVNASDCSGCIGCDPDSYVYNVNKQSELKEDSSPIPQEPTPLKAKTKPKARQQSIDKRVSFMLAEEKEESENEKLKELLGTQNVSEKTNVFGRGIKKSEATPNIFAAFNSENPPQAIPIFGPPSTTSIFGAKKESTPNGSSIFSSSLNTTPAVTTTENPSPFGGKPSEPFSSGLFGNKSSFSFASGDSIFSGPKENGDATAKSTFGAFSSTSTFGSNAFENSLNKPDSTTPTPTNIFGSSLNFGKPDSTTSTQASTNIFGSSMTSTFSFAEAAKSLDANKPTVVPEFIKNSDDSGGFAALAATASGTTPEKTWSSSTTAPAGGFFGLTVKDDFFSKNVNKVNSPEAADSSHNDESTNDENYDPHYDPIIALPDEINVSTGEEEEEKLFGERAKLYRYDAKTKEWKERGVGEIKILHHANNGTYRLILRREQIFKLVLNQLISPDFNMAPMNNSPKAFCWAGMNFAEGAGEAEQLAIRFKNEDLASSFKKTMDQCVEKLESREKLNPEND